MAIRWPCAMPSSWPRSCRPGSTTSSHSKSSAGRRCSNAYRIPSRHRDHHLFRHRCLGGQEAGEAASVALSDLVPSVAHRVAPMLWTLMNTNLESLLELAGKHARIVLVEMGFPELLPSWLLIN